MQQCGSVVWGLRSCAGTVSRRCGDPLGLWEHSGGGLMVCCHCGAVVLWYGGVLTRLFLCGDAWLWYGGAVGWGLASTVSNIAVSTIGYEPVDRSMVRGPRHLRCDFCSSRTRGQRGDGRQGGPTTPTPVLLTSLLPAASVPFP